MKTSDQYKEVIEKAKSLFIAKNADYGLSWRIMRLPSITDQIAIKAKRVRNIQETNQNLVGDSTFGEFIGMINYCTMALIQCNVGATISDKDLQANIANIYDTCIVAAYDTMLIKNADYGEAWRELRIESITDLILMKILRLKQIENNGGVTSVSEGIEANYIDILNYAVFCIILMIENEKYDTSL